MEHQITIPDLRFEQTFTKKLLASAKIAKGNTSTVSSKLNEDNTTTNKNDENEVPTSVLVKALLIDQVLMPFVQSFALTYVLYYVRPLIAFFGQQGFHAGSSLIKSIKSIISSINYKPSTRV